MSIWFRRSDDGPYGHSTTWTTRCRSDPRFDMDGTASGVLSASLEMDKVIRAKAEELGIEPPGDIEVSAWKD